MAKRKTFKDYTALGNFSAELIIKNLAFFVFLGMLGIVYIANTHYSEKKIKTIQKVEEEIKKYRWEYMALKSEVMKNTKQSEIAKEVKDQGVRSNSKTPKKIVINK